MRTANTTAAVVLFVFPHDGDIVSGKHCVTSSVYMVTQCSCRPATLWFTSQKCFVFKTYHLKKNNNNKLKKDTLKHHPHTFRAKNSTQCQLYSTTAHLSIHTRSAVHAGKTRVSVSCVFCVQTRIKTTTKSCDGALTLKPRGSKSNENIHTPQANSWRTPPVPRHW